MSTAGINSKTYNQSDVSIYVENHRHMDIHVNVIVTANNVNTSSNTYKF